MINSLSLPGYQLVDSDEQNEDIHFRLEAPTPVACEGCGVQGEFVRFGKRDVPYRDLPIHGKRVTLWGPPPIHLPGLQDNIQAPATGDGGRIPYDTVAA